MWYITRLYSRGEGHPVCLILIILIIFCAWGYWCDYKVRQKCYELVQPRTELPTQRTTIIQDGVLRNAGGGFCVTIVWGETCSFLLGWVLLRVMLRQLYKEKTKARC